MVALAHVLALASLAALRLGGIGEIHPGGNVGGSVGAMRMGALVGIVAATVVAATAATTVVAAAARGALGLFLGLGLLLLLEHGLLSGDLVEKRTEALTRVAGGHGTTLGLALGLLLLPLDALTLGALTLCGLLACGLLGCLCGCESATLLLACGLRGKALALGLLALGLLFLGLFLGLGGTRRLDLCGTRRDNGSELLFNHVDVYVLERRGCGLIRDLHLIEVTHEFLGGHPEFFSKRGNTGFCHMSHLSNLHCSCTET